MKTTATDSKHTENNDIPKAMETDYSYKHVWIWKFVAIHFMIHVLGIAGFFLVFTGHVHMKTVLWTVFVGYLAGEGITVGAHRLYTHKSFKAKPVLRFLLILFQTMAGQNSMFTWVRDHRLHHRYSDTDGDPHNSKRGFFFSHMGWLMMKKHPYVIELGKKIDMSDLQADWMVMFQKKYFFWIYVNAAFLFPVIVPIYFFNEAWWKSILVVYFLRYVFNLNATWLVNSAAHRYGTKPYDKNQRSVECAIVSFITSGEGWHNYHHVFPWDYKTAELGMPLNFSATLIRFFEKIGLAYDLKTATPEMVKNRIVRTGDGTHYSLGGHKSRSAVTALGSLHQLQPHTTASKIHVST